MLTSCHVSDLQTQASLIVATMELSVVKLLRGAIRTADLSGQRQDLLIPAPTIESRRHLTPEPVVEPRRHIRPAAIYEPSRIEHQHPRVERTALACPCPPPPPVPMKSMNPIQPPWKVLPWEKAPQPRQTVKVHRHHTDVIRKGSVLDLFV